MIRTDYKQLQKKLGYEFSDESLLIQALTHRSFKGAHNERLEFIGDSLLGMFVAEALYFDFPKATEGELTRMRSQIVKGQTLTAIAKEFELSQWLLLGPGEMKSGGHRRDSILADAVEAIIGAIYLDSGQTSASERILAWYESRLNALTLEDPIKDPKTRLQEHQQANRLSLPKYTVVSVGGPGNEQVFTVSCRIPQQEDVVTAEGSSRRAAEQAAAQVFLKRLGLEESSS